MSICHAMNEVQVTKASVHEWKEKQKKCSARQISENPRINKQPNECRAGHNNEHPGINEQHIYRGGSLNDGYRRVNKQQNERITASLKRMSAN